MRRTSDIPAGERKRIDHFAMHEATGEYRRCELPTHAEGIGAGAVRKPQHSADGGVHVLRSTLCSWELRWIMVDRPVPVGERIVSVLLMVGAVLGLIGSWMLLSGAWRHEQWISMIAPAISVPVFVWAGRQGVDLWRGNPSGRRWATRSG